MVSVNMNANFWSFLVMMTIIVMSSQAVLLAKDVSTYLCWPQWLQDVTESFMSRSPLLESIIDAAPKLSGQAPLSLCVSAAVNLVVASEIWGMVSYLLQFIRSLLTEAKQAAAFACRKLLAASKQTAAALRLQNRDLLKLYEAEKNASASLRLLLAASATAESTVRDESCKLADLHKAEQRRTAHLRLVLAASDEKALAFNESLRNTTDAFHAQQREMCNLDRIAKTSARKAAALAGEVLELAKVRDELQSKVDGLTTFMMHQGNTNSRLKNKLQAAESNRASDVRYIVNLEAEVERLYDVEDLLKEAEAQLKLAKASTAKQQVLPEDMGSARVVASSPSSSCAPPQMAAGGGSVAASQAGPSPSLPSQTFETPESAVLTTMASSPSYSPDHTIESSDGSTTSASMVQSQHKQQQRFKDFGLYGDLSVMDGPNVCPCPGQGHLTSNNGGVAFGNGNGSASGTTVCSSSSSSSSSSTVTVILNTLSPGDGKGSYSSSSSSSSSGGGGGGGGGGASMQSVSVGSSKSSSEHSQKQCKTFVGAASKRWHAKKVRKKTGYFDPARMPVGYDLAAVLASGAGGRTCESA